MQSEHSHTSGVIHRNSTGITHERFKGYASFSKNEIPFAWVASVVEGGYLVVGAHRNPFT